MGTRLAGEVMKGQEVHYIARCRLNPNNSKAGGTKYVVVPAAVAESLNIQPGDVLQVTVAKVDGE